MDITVEDMRLWSSCTATFALVCQRKGIIKVLCSLQGLNRNSKVTTMILSLVRIIKAFRDYNRTYRELSELSERDLADIGIDRRDIERVAAGAYRKAA